MSEDTTTLVESATVDDIVSDREGLVETLLERHYVIRDLIETIEVYLLPEQEVPMKAIAEHGYAIRYMEAMPKDSVFNAQITLITMLTEFKNRVHHYERAHGDTE